MALVKNIRGSSDNNPPKGYSSWKEYWEDKKHRKFSGCSCITCPRMAEVGGHVKKVYGSGEWYIVPICSKHNSPSYTDSFEVRDDDLLRVNL